MKCSLCTHELSCPSHRPSCGSGSSTAHSLCRPVTRRPSPSSLSGRMSQRPKNRVTSRSNYVRGVLLANVVVCGSIYRSLSLSLFFYILVSAHLVARGWAGARAHTRSEYWYYSVSCSEHWPPYLYSPQYQLWYEMHVYAKYLVLALCKPSSFSTTISFPTQTLHPHNAVVLHSLFLKYIIEHQPSRR